jgi:hypothetical protein
MPPDDPHTRSRGRRRRGVPHGPLGNLLPEDGPDRHPAMRVLLLIGVLLSVVLYILLWLLPVVTGIPFLILAAVLAGMASRRAARVINHQERRLPHRLRLLLRPKQHQAQRALDRAARHE